MPDSFEEQVAGNLDENPTDDAEKDEPSDRCPECGKFAKVVEIRVRGSQIVDVLACGHRIERG